MFWFAALLLVLLVAAALVWPVLRAPATLPSRAEHDAEVYGAQLRELQSDLERGAIPAQEAADARAEIGRRLLRSAAEGRSKRSGGARPGGWLAPLAGIASTVLVLAGSLLLYDRIGSPSQPDMPLTARLATDPAKADLRTLVAQTERRLSEDPSDARGWDLLLPIYLRMGRAADAVTAADNAIRLLGSTAGREAMRGEAQTQAASGEVTDAAETSFRAASRLDPANASARFHLALNFSQEGRIEEAREAWKALIDAGPADAPWMAVARAARADAERKLASGAPAAPAAAGPSAEQVAAAADLSTADRSAMIDGMVSQLSERLKSAPNDPDGWKRLMRSYAVLGDRAHARETHARAQGTFAQGSPERRSIDDFAAALGLGDAREIR